MKQRPFNLPPRDVVASLWAAYAADRTTANRNALAEAYRPLVVGVAIQLAAKLPMHVDRDDLESEGFIGLMRAIEHFDLSRGLNFTTYAPNRVRGRMLDSIRANDPVSRQVRTSARKLDDADSVLRAALGRQPTREELMEELGVDERGLDAMLKVRPPACEYLDEVRVSGSRDITVRDMVADPGATDPADLAADRDEVDVLLAPFTRRERFVVGRYLGHGMTMKKIGRKFGRTESRVSQMMKEVMPRVRARAAEMLAE